MILQMGEVAGEKRQIVHPSDLTLEYFDVGRATDAIVPIDSRFAHFKTGFKHCI
jgi:hypothetical protein